MHVTEETCRVCLGKHRLNTIFRKNLPGKIMYCAAVQVSEDDNLPKMICNQCLFYLDVAYIFRTVCEATDAKLRKHIEERKCVEIISDTIPLKAQNSEDVPKQQNSEDVPKQQNSEDVPKQQNSEDDPKQQNSEDVYFINSPIANEVVIGEEEDDIEVDIILSACEESSSSTEVGYKTPSMTEVDVNLRIADDNKEKEKIGRHTARKINAKVAKRVPTLGETFNAEPPQCVQVPENSINMIHKEVPPEISRCQPPEEVNERSDNEKTCQVPKMHQCNQCNKSFPYKSYLERHMTVHVRTKKYKCPCCDKKFINRNNLNVHMQSHSGNFPYKCKFCDRGFAWPSLLKRHLNSHTSNAEFQCQYCSKKMLHLSSLKLHEKMHLYRPSYTCDICFKTFAYTNSLATHKKIHKGVKDNVCGICKKQFTRKTSLRRHMLIHFRSKNFNFKVRLKPKIAPKDSTKKRLKCDTCNHKFGSKALLLKHLKQHNSNN